MTITADDAGSPLPSLAGAAWLDAPATRAVLDALATAGHPARVVGGAVRNALLGQPVADIDIATPARPEQVVAAVERAGFSAIPTGIAHGTVTVVAHRQALEVTTLRRDVSTDGRRATVAFTDDWALDASRRDFTINALYCDRDGRLYDPVGGWPDIEARRVRFIGVADERIAEDYLRILRFFRFHAAYATGEPDAAAMTACARGLAGVAQLSAERIRAELVKLLVAPGALAAVGAMGDIGLLAFILGSAPRPGVLAAVVAAETALDAVPDAMLRLSGLAVAVADDLPRLAARLRLATAERQALLILDDALAASLAGTDERQSRRLVYALGAAASWRRAVALLALSPAAQSEARTIAAVATRWQPPRLPVGGADLLRRGLTPGPQVGVLLAKLEAWWVENDFPAAGQVEARLAALLAGTVVTQ